MSSSALAITMGDPLGIGAELLLSVWQKRDKLNLPVFFYLGDPEILDYAASLYGMKPNIKLISSPSEAYDCFSYALPVLDKIKLSEKLPSEKLPSEKLPSEKSGYSHSRAILESISQSVIYALNKQVSGIVTLPVNKSKILDSDSKFFSVQNKKTAKLSFNGHTDFIANEIERLTGKKYYPVMLLSNSEFRCVSVTTHISLKDVSSCLSSEKLERTMKTVIEWLDKFFGINSARIAVCSLNPHAGDNGLLGFEEKTIIEPVLEKCRSLYKNVLIEGPYGADSLFIEDNRKKYDCFIAMYHDQALIPIKMIDFHNSVNITLGIPIIRTSVGHGTAYNLVGTGKAKDTSLIASLKQAADLAKFL